MTSLLLCGVACFTCDPKCDLFIPEAQVEFRQEGGKLYLYMDMQSLCSFVTKRGVQYWKKFGTCTAYVLK